MILIEIFKHKLFKHSLIYIATNIINAAIPFLILPILTRLLTPSDYGIVSMLQIAESVLIVLVGLNTHNAITVNYYKIDKEQLRIYIGNVLLILITSLMIIFIGIYTFLPILNHYLQIPDKWLLVIVVVAFFQFLITVNLVLWRVEQKPIPYGIMQISTTLLNIALSLMFVIAFHWQWQGRILGIVFSTIIFGIISLYIFYNRKYLKISINLKYIKDALKIGVPLIPHSLAGLINTWIDRIFITIMLGISFTGLYTVGYQVGMVILLIATSFNNAWVPFLFQKLKENNFLTKIKIVKFTYVYFIGIIALSLILGFIAPYIFSIFVGPKFQTASKFVIWVALGYAFNGMYYMITNYIFYAKKTYILACVTFSSAIINIALNYYLIKVNGALGAAQATAISYFIVFLAVWILSARTYKMPWKLWKVKSEKLNG
ncbi:MAG: oligosaccharide flippase family protein [Patescibacteria group bacterium]|nr:oligosaccharide flippase family protein [Patescibacteria group bacterium]MDD5715142.1 oligosaccharide flippase family protein [Patescibacteria group bacterium]